MKDITKKFRRDPEAIESLREFFKNNLKDDLPTDSEQHVHNLVELIIDIAADEFQCSKCNSKYRAFGAELHNETEVKRWL